VNDWDAIKGALEWGGGCSTVAPYPPNVNRNFESWGLEQDDIKRLTSFALERKSATDICWWLVHQNLNK